MKWPTLPRFTGAEMFFSLKTFAAAMLALYVAGRLGLSRPFWSMTTVYVVSTPLTGAVRSKAVYRLLGTALGSAATLLLVPRLANEPVLLTLAMAGWLALCLYLSLQDRTPSSYVFMLAGYTAAMIGFPSVERPDAVFEAATLRTEEICVGILCASMVHSLIFPQGLGPTVLGMVDATAGHARRWIADLITPRMQQDGLRTATDKASLSKDRYKLAADITQLRLLSTHLPFDTSHLRWAAGAISAMQDRIAALMPTLSALEDRLVALEQTEGRLAPDVVQLLQQVAQWQQYLDSEKDTQQRLASLQQLRAQLHAYATQDWDAHGDWSRLLRVSLATRLEALVDGWASCLRLRRDIDSGLHGATPPARVARLGNRELHRDKGMALLSALAAALAVCLCVGFWILTAWPSGSAAAMMAAVFCSFFASMDDPVPAIRMFLRYVLWSLPLSVGYTLLLLPMVQDFGMLALVCAPVFLLLGCYIARPPTFMAAMAILITGLCGTLGMYDTGAVDTVTLLNSMLGQIGGIVCAALVTAMVRSVGAAWSARRIQRATWAELAEMAVPSRASRARLLDVYAVRMVDRIGLLAPRMAAASEQLRGLAGDDCLRDLRVGEDLATLHRQNIPMDSPRVAGVLDELGQFFSGRSQGTTEPPSPQLLQHIDDVLRYAAGRPDSVPQWRATVTALVGLRRNLFPQAPNQLAAAPADASTSSTSSP